MKVKFVQSGGFAGLIKQCALDTAAMPPAAGKELEDLVKQSGLSASAQSFSSKGRDLEQYEIAIDDGGRKIAVVYDTKTIPPSAKRLVGYLKKCARPAS